MTAPLGIPGMDGCIRVIACLNPNPSHSKIWVLPHDGNTLYLFNTATAAWEPRVVPPNLTEIDALSCTIDGAAGRSVITDANYRIYAYLTDAGMAFELSQTGVANDPSGFVVKQNDRTRRLVGGCNYLSGGVGFGIGAQNNNVGSYFNSLRVNPAAWFSSGSDLSGNWKLLTTPQTRLTMWTWGDGREPLVQAAGTISSPSTGFLGLFINGQSAPNDWVQFNANAIVQSAPVSFAFPHNGNGEGMQTYDLAIKSASIAGLTTFTASYYG